MFKKGIGKFDAIVIGVSSGRSYAVMNQIFLVPIIVVSHMHHNSNDYTIKGLNKKCMLTVKQADEKEKIEAGYIYFAPPNFHLLVEKDYTFSLSVSELVNYVRPSMDVLFESVSDVYREKLIGVILTGANNDGSQGLKIIKSKGGKAIVAAS